MCGIVAYVGRKIAQPVLIEGLKRLEYRGYDSAGVAVVDAKGDLHIRRAVGRISVLESALASSNPLPGASLGMAMCRTTGGSVTSFSSKMVVSGDTETVQVVLAPRAVSGVWPKPGGVTILP